MESIEILETNVNMESLEMSELLPEEIVEVEVYELVRPVPGSAQDIYYRIVYSNVNDKKTKSYKCIYCPKQFTRSDLIKDHYSLVHLKLKLQCESSRFTAHEVNIVI